MHLIAKIILLTGIGAGIGLAAYAFVTGTLDEPSTVRLVIYLGMPAAVTGYSLIALFLRPEYRTAAALCLLTAGVAVYAGETYALRQANEAQRTATDRLALPGTGAKPSVPETIDTLRSQGKDAFPAVLPVRFLNTAADNGGRLPIRLDDTEIFPLGGIPNVTTVLCQEGQDTTIYVADEHGFHNPSGQWRKKPVLVAAVGDSFTHGACVPSGMDLMGQIRRQVPSALNLGSMGSGPLIQLAMIREYLVDVRPRVVLWVYFEGNDLADLTLEAENTLLRRYLEDRFRQGLMTRAEFMARALRQFVNEGNARKRKRANSKDRQAEGNSFLFRLCPKWFSNDPHVWQPCPLADFILLRNLRGALGFSAGADMDLPLFRSILDKASQTVSSWNGKIYFVYLPELSRFTRLISLNSGGLRRRDDVIQVARDTGLNVIDTAPIFAAAKDPLALFNHNMHYNSDGYARIAERIMARLKEDRVLE